MADAVTIIRAPIEGYWALYYEQAGLVLLHDELPASSARQFVRELLSDQHPTVRLRGTADYPERKSLPRPLPGTAAAESSSRVLHLVREGGSTATV